MPTRLTTATNRLPLAELPSGTQAEASINGSMATRVRASGFRDKFIKLSPDLISLSDASHAEIVGSAHKIGLPIPPLVRREHPDLFVTVPERFAIPDHTDRLKKAAAIDRLKDTLSESYFRRPCAVGVQQVDEWIEEAHYRIARDQNHANMLVGTNPDLLADIDRAWSSSGITSTFTAGFGLWSFRGRVHPAKDGGNYRSGVRAFGRSSLPFPASKRFDAGRAD